MYKAEREILEHKDKLQNIFERQKQLEIEKQVNDYKEQVLSKILQQDSDEVKAIKLKAEEEAKVKQKLLIDRLRQEIDQKQRELDRRDEEDKCKDMQIEKLEEQHQAWQNFSFQKVCEVFEGDR